MQRIPLNLNSVRAVRGIRAGLSHDAVHGELGISLPSIAKIESIYSTVPDSVLISSGMTCTVVVQAPRQGAVLAALRGWQAAAR